MSVAIDLVPVFPYSTGTFAGVFALFIYQESTTTYYLLISTY